MNKCHFLGRIQNIDFRESDESNASVISFTLEVEEIRKSAKGKKVKDYNYLDMEAWDSAAETLSSYASDGGLVAVEAIARGDGENTWFRVTNFRILSEEK
jgi:single-stranded DNA-binding protein